MNIPKYTFLNVYLKFSGEEGEKKQVEWRKGKDSLPFFKMWLLAPLFSPQKALNVDNDCEDTEAFRYFGEHFTKQTLVM